MDWEYPERAKCGICGLIGSLEDVQQHFLSEQTDTQKQEYFQISNENNTRKKCKH